MIAAIYARKSNEQNDVAEEQKSVTRQIDGARTFISSKGWALDERHIYSDDGVSGALFANRAEFQRMMVDAEAGAFEAIVFCIRLAGDATASGGGEPPGQSVVAPAAAW